MTQEDKELLLKDLCARLPYGVKAYVKTWSKLDRKYYERVYTVESVHPSLNSIYASTENSSVEVILGYTDYDIKPYLFPLSSMTEEQKRELLTLAGYEARCEESCGFDSWGFYVNIVGEYKYEDNQEFIILYPDDIGIDWLDKNHFDYRGLIEKGLALDATGLNIY